jgi:hypothetical protein
VNDDKPNQAAGSSGPGVKRGRQPVTWYACFINAQKAYDSERRTHPYGKTAEINIGVAWHELEQKYPDQPEHKPRCRQPGRSTLHH